MASIEELQREIVAEMTIELQDEPGFSAPKLAIKVKDAIRKVRSERCYQNTTYSEEKIIKDLSENQYSVIKDLALYYWNKIGAEFESMHSDNDTSRSYISEKDILGRITPFVKIF